MTENRLGPEAAIGPGLLEAYSWALAADIARRHPSTVRIFHGRPGGGQSDVLWLRAPDGNTHGGDVRLNRDGRIHIVRRFDAAPGAEEPAGVTYTWSQALAAPSAGQNFSVELAREAGLPKPLHTPAATRATLTWRLIAALLSGFAPTQAPLRIEPGFIDGNYSGPSPHFSAFPTLPPDSTDAHRDDPFGQAGYRFWFALQGEVPVLMFEQTSGTAWTAGRRAVSVDLMAAYNEHGRARGLLSVAGQLADAADLQ